MPKSPLTDVTNRGPAEAKRIADGDSPHAPLPSDPMQGSIAESFMSEFGAGRLFESPFAWYSLLRGSSPAHARSHAVWLVSRYHDCKTVLGDTAGFDDWDAADLFARKSKPDIAGAGLPGHGMPDPEASATNRERQAGSGHTLRQMLFYKALNVSSRLKNLDPFIAPACHDLIDAFIADGTFDAVNGFAVPLVVGLIGRMFGFPVQEWTRLFGAWLQYKKPADPTKPHRDPLQRIMGFGAATMAFREHLMLEFGNGRSQQADNITGAAIRANAEQQMFPVEDILKLSQLVARNAALTTTDLVGNALRCIAGETTVADELLRNPLLIVQAVEEGLRLESPVQMVSRIAVKATRVGNKDVPAGSRVLVIIGAANRDGEVFPEPDRFDLNRLNAKANLAFGYGINACAAAAIARRIAAGSLEAILERVKNLRLVERRPLTYRATAFNRGLESLWLSFERR